MNTTQRLRLQDLVSSLPGAKTLNAAPAQISSITNDSRDVAAGCLFVAIKGAKLDAHRFIPQAVQNGAAAVVCEQPPSPLPECPVVRVPDSRAALSILADLFYGKPSSSLRVTGVTGTDGKTSTTEILRSILTEAGYLAGSIGTLGYWIDGRRTYRWRGGLTTPDPIALHESFRRMADTGISDVCIEVSSHSLIQSRVANVRFDAAVLTNITRDHLDTHGTRQNYARAKRRLFEQLKPGAVAALPEGGEFTDSFRAATAARTLTYGMKPSADVSGRIISMNMAGMKILIRTPADLYSVRTRLIGTYNCENILAAATVAFAYGITPQEVKEALRALSGVPGRLEKVEIPGEDALPAVSVDYAHTPAALEKVLTTLRPLVKGQLVCVTGCGGERDREKRPIMGAIAARHADITVFTADNSRSERTEDIIKDILDGVAPSRRSGYHVEPDRRAAIELALKLAKGPDSMVVICGKGCEKYLDLGDRKIPFDDRVVARQAMEKISTPRKQTA
ncbi:MAG: UDP-N-acetylmuramoyl-L-alanyl-D-glutamate--2,6-diaminopimelate ligase [Planctomycetes bacterium]|nr:UDP-N-acetylmuramoyl-L-alanyl-D-glutamate--2,6-diaminopimelate ligase [Planctomycetota bacterium]